MPLYGKAKSGKPPAAAVSGQGAHPGTAPQKSARSVGTCWRPGMAGALKRVGHRGRLKLRDVPQVTAHGDVTA